MASTSLTLGDHWETFIKSEVASGRFGSASEVVRAALRELEDRGRKLEVLRAHLAQGADEAARGEFVDGYSIKTLIQNQMARAGA